MTGTITDAMTAATQAVTDNAGAYQAAAARLNNEIGNTATGAGMDPTQNPGTTLQRAIRSGQLSFAHDVSTTPGVITVNPALPHTTYRAGLPLNIWLNNDIAGPTVVDLSGLGNKPLRYVGGGELGSQDFLKNDTVTVLMDASTLFFFIVNAPSRAVIDTAITKTVHGPGADFTDLNAAMAWLNRRRISATGSVTLQVASGVGANRFVYASSVNLAHPDGARISILGQTLAGTLPAGPSMSYTGNGAAARATDTGVNLTLLRNFFGSELYFQGGCGIHGVGQIGLVQDLLLTSDGTAGADLLGWGSGVVTLNRIAAVGSGAMGFNTGSGSFVITGTCFAIGGASHGFGIGAGGCAITGAGGSIVSMSNALIGVAGFSGLLAGNNGQGSTPVYARGNGSDGVTFIGGRCSISSASVSRDNGGSGFATNSGRLEAIGTTASGNTNHGYAANGGGFVDALNTTGTGNSGYGYLAQDGGNLRRTGGTATGATAAASPAAGATGNNNAYIS